MEYPSNSFKSKEMKEEPEVVLEKAAPGEVKFRKKVKSKLASRIFSEDISNVRQYVIDDIVIPKIKDIFYYVISDSVEMMLWGGASRRGRSDPRPGARRNYSSIFDDRRGTTNSRYDQPRPRVRMGYNLDEIILNDKGTAERILYNLRCMLDRGYDAVTVVHLYEELNATPPDHTASQYGWRDLSTADVIRDRDGWRLYLPEPRPLNER